MKHICIDMNDDGTMSVNLRGEEYDDSIKFTISDLSELKGKIAEMKGDKKKEKKSQFDDLKSQLMGEIE